LFVKKQKTITQPDLSASSWRSSRADPASQAELLLWQVL